VFIRLRGVALTYGDRVGIRRRPRHGIPQQQANLKSILLRNGDGILHSVLLLHRTHSWLQQTVPMAKVNNLSNGMWGSARSSYACHIMAYIGVPTISSRVNEVMTEAWCSNKIWEIELNIRLGEWSM
ncbi:hypothetical protein Tco_0956833, partial [Tanacetum coccineum]